MSSSTHTPLVIFDLDGTVIDSTSVMVPAFRIAYARVVGCGEAPVDRFLNLLGAPFPEILDQLGLPPEMHEAFRRESRARIARTRVHSGVVRACVAALDAGCVTAVCTGKDRQRTTEILKRFSLLPYFNFMVTGDDPVRGKPSPHGVLHLCREAGVTPRRAVVVGDSSLDIAAGRAAGTHTIGCLWGVGTVEELRRASAHQLVARPDELTGVLKRWYVGL